MALQLYAHPFSSYCQKVVIALYENAIPFELRLLSPEHPDVGAEFAQLWPLQRMPVLVDQGVPVMEATIIIEHLDLHHPGAVRMIPSDAKEALPVRFLDRFFDNYVMTPMQRIVFDYIRPLNARDPQGVVESRQLLERAYAWLNDTLKDRYWAAGERFTLADCAAAPSLFYSDWVHPIPEGLSHVRAYRRRLLERPSVAKAVDEGRPYRAWFPPGAPDRD